MICADAIVIIIIIDYKLWEGNDNFSVHIFCVQYQVYNFIVQQTGSSAPSESKLNKQLFQSIAPTKMITYYMQLGLRPRFILIIRHGPY
jgi:phage terminase small subunit